MPYPPLTAARLAGISVSSVKNYSQTWPEHFSPTANPPRGQKRSYTDKDVATLRTIARLSRESIPTEDIGQQLAEGVDDWQPTDSASEPISGPQQTPQQTAALALASQWHALQNAFEAERAERQDLAQRLQDAEIRAARLEAELSAARRPWYRRLFG